MPQRPKLWIHRTRRFWVDLAVLVLLVMAFITTSNLRIEARYQKDSADPAVAYGNRCLQISGAFKDSSFSFFVMNGPFPDTPHDGFDLIVERDSEPRGIQFWPTLVSYEIA